MRLFIILLLLIFCPLSYCQQDSLQNNLEEDYVIFFMEEAPQVEGGFEAFKKWISENNKLVGHSDTLTFSDYVAIEFYIDTTGNLINIKIVKSLGILYDQEAIRLVSECPLKWTPASQGKNNLVVPFTIPIRFVNEKKNKNVR